MINEKLKIINRYWGDTAKASERTLIALENCPHWRTGVPKTLIEGTFGFNDLEEEKDRQKKEKDSMKDTESDEITLNHIRNTFICIDFGRRWWN